MRNPADDLTGLDPEDSATIAVFREINQEHLVPSHEPQDALGEPDSPEETPGPAGLPDPTRAAGEAAGPGDTLDALVEQHRQQNVAEPQLGDWIREALGADSVRIYLERMETALRPVTT